MRTIHYYFLYLAIIGLLSASCSEFLDSSPDRALAIPSTVEEYERMLNSNRFYTSDPSLADFAADDYQFTSQLWAGAHFRMRNTYIWAPDIYEGSTVSGAALDWNNPYDVIYHANVVLEGLSKLTEYDQVAYNQVKGHALFLRGFQHFMLYQVYGQPFRPTTAATDLGIPLRLTPDLEATVARSTVEATLDQVVADLEQALLLLPSTAPTAIKYWSSKAAAAAMLGRVYLTLRDYESALASTEICMGHYDRLLDYNTLPATFVLPLPIDNPEILFESTQAGTSGLFMNTNTFVDTILFAQYESGDLRKQVFFKPGAQTGRHHFHSMYSGNQNSFSGLAMDEVYLTRAECQARLGYGSEALATLNHLLIHRYSFESFEPIQLSETDKILTAVLAERRKELVLRNTRWSDLRRLNQYQAFAITLKRVIDDAVYELYPSDPRYAFPIPPREIQLSNLPQNER